MSTKKPAIPDELRYLGVVLATSKEQDDPNDLELKRYRELLEADPKFVFQQKRIAEKEYREELEGYRKKCRERSSRKRTNAKADHGELCEVVVGRILRDWNEVK